VFLDGQSKAIVACWQMRAIFRREGKREAMTLLSEALDML
jgi:hypothetical protein